MIRVINEQKWHGNAAAIHADYSGGDAWTVWIRAGLEGGEQATIFFLIDDQAEQIADKLDEYLVAIGRREKRRMTDEEITLSGLFECPECCARFHGAIGDDTTCPDCGESAKVPCF